MSRLRDEIAIFLRQNPGQYKGIDVARRFGWQTNYVYSVNKEMGGNYLRKVLGNKSRSLSQLVAEPLEECKLPAQRIRVVNADGSVEEKQIERKVWREI